MPIKGISATTGEVYFFFLFYYRNPRFDGFLLKFSVLRNKVIRYVQSFVYGDDIYAFGLAWTNIF